MPRTRGVQRDASLLSSLARTLGRAGTPEGAIAAFLSALAEEIPGAGAWALRRERPGESAACVWVPREPAPPFPSSILAKEGSLAASVIVSGRAVEISESALAEDRSPESSYLRRRGGDWLFLPLTGARPDGVLLLRTPAGALAAGARDDLDAAAGLLHPFLGLLVSRQDTERRVAQRVFELSLFYETSRALAFAKSAQEISSLLGHHLGPALGLNILGLIALQPDGPEMYIEVPGAPSGAALRSFRHAAVKEAQASLGFETGSVKIRINRPARLSRSPSRSEPAALHVPLMVQDRPVGFLSAHAAGEQIEESRIRLFCTVASQAALTLERVRLVEEAGLLRMQSVLESMREGVLLVDRSLAVRLANPAARRLGAEIAGAPLPRRLRRIGPVSLTSLMEGLDSGGPDPDPMEITSPEADRLYQVTVSAVKGLRGELEGAILVLSDVTDQRRIQEQLSQSEKLSSLGQMISGVAHELNNPLTSIMGFAQLLGMSELPLGYRRKIESINEEASRCHRIVQNLLRFARNSPPVKEPVDLNSVVGSVVQLLGYQLQADNIILDVHLDRNMRCILGDSHALQQVFVNVVTNAHHALRERGGRGLLRIATSCDGAACRAEITDNGPGIRPEHAKKIFDPFFSTKEVGRGTGLGLSIAYGTIKDHGGEIRAQSRLGHGTTFVIEIPVHMSAMPDLAPVAKAAPAQRERNARPRRILVVEDEPTLSAMICEALLAEGHLVDAAADGVAAKRMLEAASYDLIISDLKMPNMGGRELYAAVHASDPDLARRIIFSTGDSVSEDTQAFFAETGNPHLTKPFNLVDLFKVIDSALPEA